MQLIATKKRGICLDAEFVERFGVAWVVQLQNYPCWGFLSRRKKSPDRKLKGRFFKSKFVNARACAYVCLELSCRG